MEKKAGSKQAKITKIEVTNDKISGRGGLFFFMKYVENIRFFKLFENCFGFVKGSSKGLSCVEFIKQLVVWFIDGTDTSMKSFDHRKGDETYASLLETQPGELATSHQIKRMFRKFMFVGQMVFRSILLEMFIWRLRVEQPEIIILFGDSVVFDNDDAHKREGANVTYKMKKGFQPMQISWGPYVVDALFRAGDVHCNHGTDFMKAVGRLTKAIRRRYKDVPIIILTDAGFLDDQNFRFFEERLGIHFVCPGKLYDDIKEYVNAVPLQAFSCYNQSWTFVEFGNRLKSWEKFRRCIFTSRETEENGQLTFEFARPDSVIYTNLGQSKELDDKLMIAGGGDYFKTESIIKLNHSRGRAELVHRSEKEFIGREQLPFERFGMNRAFYYIMLMSHFLYETYKRDVTSDVLPVTGYPNTFRRVMIDFAVKIVSKGGNIILKVTQTVYDTLKISDLWTSIKEQESVFVT
jgi:hypothetical protein